MAKLPVCDHDSVSQHYFDTVIIHGEEAKVASKAGLRAIKRKIEEDRDAGNGPERPSITGGDPFNRSETESATATPLAFEFWNDPSEDGYTMDDGDPPEEEG